MWSGDVMRLSVSCLYVSYFSVSWLARRIIKSNDLTQLNVLYLREFQSSEKLVARG
jgi:hypothetical protein